MGAEGEQVRRFPDLAFPTRALESAEIPCQSANRWAILHRRVKCTTCGNEASAELPITRFYPGVPSVDGADLLDLFIQIVLPFTIVTLGLLIFWALPVYLGVRWARKKGYSPLWMLFGLNPMGTWIAAAILQYLPPRERCVECQKFIRTDFDVCPYCRCDVLDFAPEETTADK